MTQSSKTSRSRTANVGRIKLVATAVAVLTVLPWLFACDTVAWIPFSDRNFTRIAPGAMAPTGDTCGGIVGGEATKTMVFIDNDGKPVKLGEDVETAVVEPHRDDVEFSDEAVFSLPDVECGGDGDCPSGFECDSQTDRCRTGTGVAVQRLEYSEDNEPETQALVVAMADVGAWRGWYSTELGGYYPFDPEADDPVDPSERLESIPVSALGVDRDNRRGHATSTLANYWDALQGYVEEDGRDAYFGLWTFAQNTPGETTSKVADVHADEEVWTDDGDDARLAVSEIDRDPDDRRANVYASLLDVLDDAFNDPALADELDTARVVVVVPGHDEVRENTADDVIDEINELSAQTGVDISMSIVQVDAARSVSAIPDDWAYYTGAEADQDPCSSDDDCHNFETCRQPTWYTDNPEATTEDDVEYPREDERGESFCLPDYDDNGRLGPIADYDRIACETGGAYYYVPEVSQQLLEEYFRAQVWGPEANWEMDVVINDYVEGEPALLQSDLEVTIGRSENYRFEREREDRDRRRVFFTP